MALRAKEGLAPDRRSATAGEPVRWSAKIENTGAEPRRLRFEGEATNVQPPLRLASVEGPQVAARKTRTVLTFTWIAATPVPGEAKTLRGEVRLVDDESGAVVVKAPLDVYVAAGAAVPTASPVEPEPEVVLSVRRRPGVSGGVDAEGLPDLDLDGLDVDRVVARVRFARGQVVGPVRRTPVILPYPPEGERPAVQALLREALNRAHGLGHDWVLALGDADLFRGLSFRPDPPGILPPDEALPLLAHRLRAEEAPAPAGKVEAPADLLAAWRARAEGR